MVVRATVENEAGKGGRRVGGWGGKDTLLNMRKEKAPLRTLH